MSKNTNNNSCVIIYGDVGSGKTTNAQLLAAYYAKDTIVDDWDGQTIHKNALLLTSKLGTQNAVHLTSALINVKNFIKRLNFGLEDLRECEAIHGRNSPEYERQRMHSLSYVGTKAETVLKLALAQINHHDKPCHSTQIE